MNDDTEFELWIGAAAAAGLAVGTLILVLTAPGHAADGFVQMLERSVGMQPGQTRVLPECGCTVRYMGTSVKGRHYTVRIDRLD